MWGEDLDFRTGPIANLRPDAPLRARPVQTGARYEIVTIVGNRSFPANQKTSCGTLEDELGPRSALALAKSACGAYISRRDDLGGFEGERTPVRLNAWTGGVGSCDTYGVMSSRRSVTILISRGPTPMIVAIRRRRRRHIRQGSSRRRSRPKLSLAASI